jgi:hypothetical protein
MQPFVRKNSDGLEPCTNAKNNAIWLQPIQVHLQLTEQISALLGWHNSKSLILLELAATAV